MFVRKYGIDSGNRDCWGYGVRFDRVNRDHCGYGIIFDRTVIHGHRYRRGYGIGFSHLVCPTVFIQIRTSL